MRKAVSSLVGSGHIGPGVRNGAQVRVAEHFGVTRQRISQIAREVLDRRSLT